MAMQTTQLKTWGIVQWQAQVKHVAPSAGGAVGVIQRHAAPRFARGP